MPFPVPENHKFACVALEGPALAADLPDPHRIDDDVWALKTAPIEVDDWWLEGLGSWQLQQYKRCDLFLFATMKSARPMIVDGENTRLTKVLYALLYSLQIHEAARFSQGQLLTGARVGDGDVGLRQHSMLPECYGHSRAHMAVVDAALLARALAMSGEILRLFGETDEEAFLAGAQMQQHSRIRRGFNALLAGLREEYGNQRLHHFVRALEAVTHPPIFRTKKTLVSRCTLFAGGTAETRQVLNEIYDLRSAEEHLNAFERVLSGHAAPVDVGTVRSYQAEVLACQVYRRILGDAALRAEFATDESTDGFWDRAHAVLRAAWGPPFDITETRLRATGRLEG